MRLCTTIPEETIHANSWLLHAPHAYAATHRCLRLAVVKHATCLMAHSVCWPLTLVQLLEIA
jgi:hypothetical protein